MKTSAGAEMELPEGIRLNRGQDEDTGEDKACAAKSLH
jgi:hypothetical protein